MGYSAEVVQRARARLAQAKEDRESENRQHLAEAYAKVPRIREIDMLLRRTMAQAAQAAFLQGSDGQALLEQARRENISLQQERAALAAANFEDGFLDESPICDKCGGSGYVGTTMCECLSELCRQEQKKEISVLSNSRETFSQFRLDYYPDAVDPKYGASPRTIMERTLNICRRYAAKSAVHRRDGAGKDLPVGVHRPDSDRPGLQRCLRNFQPPVLQAGAGKIQPQ